MAGPREHLGLDDEPSAGGRLSLPVRRFSPLRNIGVRVLIAVACVVVVTAIAYLERDCYSNGDTTGTLTVLDALYYATVTLSTTGYGDIAPVCETSRLVNVVVVTPLRFLFLIVLIGTTIEVLTRRTRDEFRTSRWRQSVKDHTVVIGFGVKGRSAVRTLLDSGLDPLRIVVVSPDPESIAEATRMGLAGVVGDARREDVLLDAAADKAARIIVATDQDDTSVLVTLTARRLSPNATIVAAVREAINAQVLRQSGADGVIPTAESAGRLLGLSLLSPTAGNLMEDLLDSGRGLEVVERDITREELGVSPAELDARGEIVLAVIRGGIVHRFDRHDVRLLQKDDRIVVIRSSPEI
ncbi:MAG: potassium channel family protein [Candidatus Nanopelagicales bacterium]